jgi:hypothetical protein
MERVDLTYFYPDALSDQYHKERYNQSTIEEFFVDPEAMLKDWFGSEYRHYHSESNRHLVDKILLTPESLNLYGFVIIKDRSEALPVNFIVQKPSIISKLRSAINGKSPQGTIHGWMHTAITVKSA